ncbi:MAG TPA: anhydro-N-acetylmuramic acid kinase [Burkholderiales bacterium]|nr:anhydro-N-acetylmuramic acid kinase [Burkholderiales bacterium]
MASGQLLGLTARELFVGLMSGTSLDGVDAALVEFAVPGPTLIETAYLPFPAALKAELHALQAPGPNELDRAARAGNALSGLYAGAVLALLRQARIAPAAIRACGCHGQTVRHRPDAGYTLQIGNPALLAELTGISVVADFRSRDIAAGGQGAPLAPAFHAAVFRTGTRHRVIVNIGGIANLSDLPASGAVTGFDTGPGNVLLDLWIHRHLGETHDRAGAWAQAGTVLADMLEAMLAEPYFARRPPKSCGRDLFNAAWLGKFALQRAAAQDVQATLAELSARVIAKAVEQYCPQANEVYVCGGGAHNLDLLARLRRNLPRCRIDTTAALGTDPDWVEAIAFAWLAQQTLAGRPANLPAVTGAGGDRVLGAIYPA